MRAIQIRSQILHLCQQPLR